MTGNELMSFSLGLLGESKESAADYGDYALSVLNIILAECFEVNNALLESQTKPVIPTLIQLKSLDENIPFVDILVISCLSYGLAAKLVLEDNSDRDRFNYFTQMYVQAMGNNTKYLSTQIADVYGGED